MARYTTARIVVRPRYDFTCEHLLDHFLAAGNGSVTTSKAPLLGSHT